MAFLQLNRRLINLSFKYSNKPNIPNRNLNLILINNKTRLFSTTSNRNAIPPFLWMFIKPISKLAAIILGR